MARRLAPLLAAGLLIGLLPGTAAAATPVAVDDPGAACQDPSSFGGSFPIPEDFSGGEPGFERWFLFFGDSLSPGSCGVLENDIDADGDPLSLASVVGGQHGQAVIVDPTSLAFLPEPDWSTPEGDWFSDGVYYTASDGTTESNVAVLRIWLAPINDPPSFTAGQDVVWDATDGAYAAAWATDISAGPSNEAEQSVAFEITDDSDPSLFAAGPAIDGDGVLSFTPTGSGGSASITVRAVDDGGLTDYGLPAGTMDPPDDTSDAVTFTITITAAVEHDPVAVADQTTIVEDAAATTIDVLANDTDADGDPLTVTAAGPASTGTVSVTPDGAAVRYTPAADASGTDSFLYEITDATGRTATNLVTVTITPLNDRPTAVPDAASVPVGSGPVAIPVLANDVDVDGDALTVVAVSQGKRGTVAVTGGGTGLTYDPAQNKHGPDTFTYTISDGHGGTHTTTVSVTIVRDR